MATQLETARPGAPSSWRVALGALLVLVVVAAVGYLAGRHQGERAARTHVMTGRAYVGLNEASVRVDGWAYGFAPNDVTWFDSRGSHEGNSAPCLRQAGTTATITFGWVNAAFPDGSGERNVVWVRCR